jgi:hypothetical protein
VDQFGNVVLVAVYSSGADGQGGGDSGPNSGQANSGSGALDRLKKYTVKSPYGRRA